MSNYLVITGGSRGIGEKTIEYFINEGWKAVNLSRSPCNIPEVINIKVNLTKPDSLQEAAKQIQAAVNGAEQIALVHNAAFYQRDHIDKLSMADLVTTMNTNVISSVALNQILIPAMRPGSSIIYIGSTLSEKAVPGSASYTISKHAVIGLMKATCQDLKDKHIRSCCVNPGLVDTQLLKETMDDETLTFLLNTQVIGKRLIQPEEIAKVIYFCATTDTINGTIIRANLGQVAD
jgi:NAD(P)-dependent dehydrogenase (short-subunit alcohol dehydrogenase family)